MANPAKQTYAEATVQPDGAWKFSDTDIIAA